MRGKLCASYTLRWIGLRADYSKTVWSLTPRWQTQLGVILHAVYIQYKSNTARNQTFLWLSNFSKNLGPMRFFFSRFLLKTPYWLTQRSVEVFELKIRKFAETNLRVHCVINCSRLLTCLRSDKKVCIMKAVSSLSLSTTPKILVSWHFLPSPPPFTARGG